MWACPKCSESSDDSFDACWKCGTSRDGSPPPPDGEPETRRVIDCLRCKVRLLHVGTKHFHEGANWGLLGGLGELFVKQERFDLYRCPLCGKVEFFITGPDEAAP